jgi:hypothetical protein
MDPQDEICGYCIFGSYALCPNKETVNHERYYKTKMEQYLLNKEEGE